MVAVAAKHGGNSTFINSFDNTQFLFHSPTDTAPQFLWKLQIDFTAANIILKIVGANAS